MAVITLVLILVVGTYAWFVSNRRVDATETTVTSSALEPMEISFTPDELDNYKGQTGVGGLDAPFFASRTVDFSYRSTKKNDCIVCSVSDVTITLSDAYAEAFGATTISESTEGYADITSYFTWRVEVLDDDKNVIGTFMPQPPENDSNRVVDDEGNTLKVRDKNYFDTKLVIGTTAYQCSATLRVKIIFLDEESYKNYLNDNPSGITPFKFSDINFMGCSFSVGITLGVEQVGALD
ncbi:MAG: hypothetical protein ACI4SK_00145 [Christensenellales bacterium]